MATSDQKLISPLKKAINTIWRNGMGIKGLVYKNMTIKKKKKQWAWYFVTTGLVQHNTMRRSLNVPIATSRIIGRENKRTNIKTIEMQVQDPAKIDGWEQVQAYSVRCTERTKRTECSESNKHPDRLNRLYRMYRLHERSESKRDHLCLVMVLINSIEGFF